jgi:hypothetical protein
MISKLKCCRNCYSNSIAIRKDGGYYYGICENCGARDRDWHSTIIAAILAWNWRNR